MENNINMHEYSYRNANFDVIKNKKIVIWGLGQNYKAYQKKLRELFEVVAVYDADLNKRERKEYNGIRVCRTPDEIAELTDFVVITVQSEKAREDIVKEILAKGMTFAFVEDVIGSYRRSIARKSHLEFDETDVPFSDNVKMKAYIGLLIPEYVCNLKCRYCYITQHQERHHLITDMKDLSGYIGKKLSNKNIGGSALIGLCGTGETFLGDEFIPICIELLKQGHYLHIVTNGVVTDKIRELIHCAGQYASHIFLKLSFHYEQLKKYNLLSRFAETVQFIDDSPASYSVELMPHDEIISDINEIKKYSMENFGALPQLTVGRDDTEDYKLLTNLSYEEYYSLWEQFDSPLFEYKMKMYKVKGKKCMCGQWGFNVDLETGNISRCTIVNESIGNLYDENMSLDFEAVGNKCPLDYCYNCHVYGPLGIMLMDKKEPTYLQMRDRVKSDGTHWIKKPMANFLSQKIYDNNL